MKREKFSFGEEVEVPPDSLKRMSYCFNHLIIASLDESAIIHPFREIAHCVGFLLRTFISLTQLRGFYIIWLRSLLVIFAGWKFESPQLSIGEKNRLRRLRLLVIFGKSTNLERCVPKKEGGIAKESSRFVCLCLSLINLDVTLSSSSLFWFFCSCWH